MNKKHIYNIAAGLIMLLITFPLYVPKVSAAVSSWQKGVTILPRFSTDFSSGSFQQSVRNAQAAHANYVSLVIPLYQSNTGSVDIQTGGNTPTDQSLTDGIKYIHSQGLHVLLMPHLDTFDGQWRASINPGDRNGWFANYGNMINHYAAIAQSSGVEEFSVGAELINMSTYTSNGDNTGRWNTLIGNVRNIYSGKLTYSSNWGACCFSNEDQHIGFWPALDFIGISAYYELQSGSNNDVGALKNSWNKWNNSDIAPLQQQFGKPVVFTEVGYKSVSGSHNQPWNYGYGGGYDGTEQATDYTALFDFWNNQSFMQGVFFWDWSSDPNAGGEGNIDYTPQHKPAQDVLSSWFGGTAGGGGTPPPSPVSCAGPATGAFTGCYYNDQNLTNAVLSRTDNTINFDWGGGSPDPSVPNDHFSARWQGNFNFNAGAYTFTATADDGVKIYVDGNLIIDKFIDQPATTYTSSHNLTAGSHLVRMDYYENGGGAVAKLSWAQTSGSRGGGTPPGSTSINTWWPVNSVTVCCTQPFKAVIPDMSLGQYSMFWQVDGGGLVSMFDVGDHKESTVDLFGWNWHGGGPYNVNFVAKDSGGNTIAQQGVNIFVSH